MRDGDRPDEPDVPIGELTEEPARPRGRRRRARVTAVVAVVAVVAATGAAFAAHVANDGANGTDDAHRLVTPDDTAHGNDASRAARVAVGAALEKTVATRSFDMQFRLSATEGTAPPTTASCPMHDRGMVYVGPDGGSLAVPVEQCPYAPVQQEFTISGTGTINVHPTAMVSVADVPGLGKITTRVDGTNVWENGGGDYGMTGPDAGPGQPLSGFAGLVSGTLGPREGAVAMNSLASPTGYLDLAMESITSAAKLSDDVVDGVAVKRYEVGIDTMREIDRADLTTEELVTMKAALAVLRAQGYRSTKVLVSVDAFGLIRRAQTTITFADGGTVDADVTFSNFGCSIVEIRTDGPWIVPNPSGCVASQAGSTTSTSAPGAPTTVVVPAPSGVPSTPLPPKPSLPSSPTTVVTPTTFDAPAATSTSVGYETTTSLDAIAATTTVMP